MQLRPYQVEAVQNVKDDWRDHDSVLIVAATGTGKTQMFCQIINDVCENGSRALVLVHRRDLVIQARDRLVKYWPEWKFKTGVVMAEYNETNRQILFGTVQTVPNRSIGKIDYMVIDEGHHATSTTYQETINTLREINPGMKLLGVTATPIRSDGKAMRNVFEKVSAVYDIKFAVKNGYLVPPRWLAVQTGVSLVDVSTHYRDGEREYSTKGLADVYETDNCFELVVETHKRYADGRKAIAFVPTVAGAYRLAETFSNAGITAVASDAKTSKDDRARTLNDFRSGKIDVLVNVALYTEGLDVPEVSCIHQVRPTQSDSMYIQMIGRGLRTFPGKPDCLILDYAPEDTRQIVMLGDVLGAVRKDAYIKDVMPGEVAGGFVYNGEIEYMEGDAAEIITKQLDYLDMTPWSWYRDDKGWMSLGLGEGEDGRERTILISTKDDGMFQLWAVMKGRGAIMRLESEWDSVKEQADKWAEQYADPLLAQRKKRWRKQHASEKQKALLVKWKLWGEGMSKGDAAMLITHRFAKFSLPKEG